MSIRCHFKLEGGHVHCRIFGPGLGKAGDLVFAEAEWVDVQCLCSEWDFIDDGAITPRHPPKPTEECCLCDPGTKCDCAPFQTRSDS